MVVFVFFFFLKYVHLNTFNLTWFMKVACQHLLRRRDLSCTKVNAVNRLSECLYASFRLSKKKEAAPPATTARGPAARQGCGPPAAGSQDSGFAGSRQTDAALPTGKGSGPYARSAEERSNHSTLRVSNISVLHLRPALSYPFQAAGLEIDCLPS